MKFAQQKFLHILALLPVFFGIQVACAYGQLLWQQTSGPSGGMIYGLATAPNNSVFASTDAGVFRSTDRGQHWELIGDDVWHAKRPAIAVAGNGDVYVGTPAGIFRSPDNGNAWYHVYQHDSSSGVVHIGVAPDGGVYAVIGTRLIRSDDQGESWQTLSVGLYFLFAFKPTGEIFSYNLSSVLRSTNRGQSWKVVRESFVPGARYIHGIGLNERGDLFADTEDGMYISTDNGDSWKVNNLGPAFMVFTMGKTSGTVIAGSQTLYRSTNNGHDWYQAGLSEVRTIAASPEGEVYAGTPNGVYKISNDQSYDWVEVNDGLISTDVRSITSLPDGKVLTGVFNKGVYRTDDPMEYWYRTTRICSPSMLVSNSKGVVFGGSQGILFRSNDKGSNWEIAEVPANCVGIRSVTFDANDRAYAVFGNGSIIRSDSDYTSWTECNTGLGDKPDIALVNSVPGNIVYAVTTDSMLYRSDDQGRSWYHVSNLPVQPSVVHRTRSGMMYIGTPLGLLRSLDNGTTWIACQDIPAEPITGIVTINKYATIVSTATHGVWISTNEGSSWIEQNEGLPSSPVQGMTVTPSGNILVATEERGVYMASTGMSDVPSSRPVSDQSVSTVSPVPATTAIAFRYRPGKPCSLFVYNGCGQSVIRTTLPASGTATVPVSDLQNGVYRYRIISSAGQSTGGSFVVQR